MNIILYAIPFFFLLILLELSYGLIRGRNTYRFNDTINSLSMGSLSRLQGLVILGASGTIYELIVANYQLVQLGDDQVWVWLSCFVLYDLAYYWKHRFGHEVALFWGAHVAHHQSEDYNLGTALRQTSVDFYGFLFYLPFFVLGYPAEILFTVVSLNLIYQFWVHTEHVPKLGPLEWVFVTPSNHRVHHARNTIYVDRNYGGVFIVWDRLFGSFQEELDQEAVVFGLRKPLNSWNPIWANVHVYWRLLQDSIRAPGLANKVIIWFKPPGWLPSSMQSSCKLRERQPSVAVPDEMTIANAVVKTGVKTIDKTMNKNSAKFDPPISKFCRLYGFNQFVVTVLLSLYALINSGSFDYLSTLGLVIFLSYSYYVHGIWMEARTSAVRQEIFRLLILLLAVQLLVENSLAIGILTAYAVASLLLLGVFNGKLNSLDWSNRPS